jgi:hypothetical protein
MPVFGRLSTPLELGRKQEGCRQKGSFIQEILLILGAEVDKINIAYSLVWTLTNEQVGETVEGIV